MYMVDIEFDYCFFFQAEDGIRDVAVTGVQTCALPISTAFTSGSCWPSRIAPKIHSGSVFCAPAVNTVTMTSSKDRAKASSAPETSAVALKIGRASCRERV